MGHLNFSHAEGGGHKTFPLLQSGDFFFNVLLS